MQKGLDNGVVIFINTIAVFFVGVSLFHLRRWVKNKDGSVVISTIGLLVGLLLLIYAVIVDIMIASGIEC